MKEECKYSLGKLISAYKTLKEGTIIAKDDLSKDGVIQRFEFTFELLWKTIRIFLKDKGVNTNTPKDCLKEAFKNGWIDNEEAFIKMLEDRNLTSHAYWESKSLEIFNNILSKYTAEIESVIKKLENILKDL